MSSDVRHSPAAPTSDDLLAQETIKETVRQAYRAAIIITLAERNEVHHVPAS